MTNAKRSITLLVTAAVLALMNQPVKADNTFDFDLSEFAAAQGDEAHTTSTTGEGPQGVGADVTSNLTNQQDEQVQETAQLGLLTQPGIYNSFPSGQYSFGFTGGGATTYGGGLLPQTATSSVDANITIDGGY